MRGGAEGASRCTGHKRGRKGHGARATTTTTTVMAGERVKLPVTNSAVPTANWSDYTQIRTYARTHIILSSGSHYLRTHIITLYIRVCVCVCKSKKKEKKNKKPLWESDHLFQYNIKRQVNFGIVLRAPPWPDFSLLYALLDRNVRYGFFFFYSFSYTVGIIKNNGRISVGQ